MKTKADEYSRFEAADFLDGIDGADDLHKALPTEGNPTWFTVLQVTGAAACAFTVHPAA